MKRLIIAAVLALAVAAAIGSIAYAGQGNGAPSGPHFNLNIIGVSQDKTAAMDYEIGQGGGSRIFVPLWGNTQIWLTKGDDFQVLDANGTDKDGASFMLPNPDPTNSGTTSYSVFARALGKPNGQADMTTCAYVPNTTETVCSVEVLTLKSSTGPSKFQNVSKYLLYIYTSDGTRVPLFDSSLDSYFWQYDNQGLKLAQLRFYPGVCTLVPSGTNPDGTQQIVQCLP